MNLSVNDTSQQGPGSAFWAVSLDGGTPDPDTASLKGFLEASPFTVLRYDATWIDQENWSRGCYYDGTSACLPVHNNVTGFANLCKSSPQYYCILGVPAEINNVSTMTYEVEWLQRTTGWEPNCWAIGNEPEVWTHFGIPWTSWQAPDDRTPTAAQFALLAENYTDTLRSIDGPDTCIIGLESNDPIPNIESFTNATTAAVPNDTAVSFHSYPDDKCDLNGVGSTTAPVTQLLSPANLTLTQASYNDSVANAHGVPVDIQEFNMGSASASPLCDPWVAGYTDSVFTSAVVAQALTYGVPQFTFFHFYCKTSDCLVDETTRVPDPTYWLYTDLLSQMDLAQIQKASFTAGGSPETFAVLGENGTHDRTLLLSNAQPYGWLNVSVASFLPSTPTDTRIQIISQSSETGVTTSQVWNMSTVPTYLTIRNQSTILVHFWSNVSFSAPVSFTESGLPAGTTWTVDVSGQAPLVTTIPTSGTAEPSITLNDGLYSLSEASSNSSWAPPPSIPSFFVDGSALVVPFVFTLVTYPVQFAETGLPDGTNWSVNFNGTTLPRTSSSTSGPLLFPAVPNGTYPYRLADVPGFYQSTLPYSGTLTVDGAALAENVAFDSASYSVLLSESGLPSGLPWSVKIDGTVMSLTTDGGTDDLTWTGLANGTYAYTITDISGWHQTTLAYSGYVVVDGAAVTEPTLVFTEGTYVVTFAETGLPVGMSWSVTFSGVEQSSNTSAISFDDPNGTYDYSTSARGYGSVIGRLTVSGQPVAPIPVGFAPSSASPGFSTLDYVLLGADVVAVAVAVAIGVALVKLRRRGKAPPASTNSQSPAGKGVPPPPPK
ncbi:MAG: hypothetical protein WA688_05650 [Thermoplasmata archaeon]